MTPAQAAKLMAEWGTMFSGAATQLEGLAQRQDSQDALEANYKRLDAELRRVVAETEAARATHKAEAESFARDTHEYSEQRRRTLADMEAVATRSRTAAEQHSLEVVTGLEAQRDALKFDVQILQKERDTLARNLADMRAIISDMAKR